MKRVPGLLTVFEFLLGVDFDENEVLKRGPEPIDVWFREARFQVTEVLDRGRQRNREIRKWVARVKSAQRIADLRESVDFSGPQLTPEELVEIAVQRSDEKLLRYGGGTGTIDLLIYINLKHAHSPQASFSDVDTPSLQKWRSVSVVMERFAMVLFAARNAPSFLVSCRGEPLLWSGLDSVFPQWVTLPRTPSAPRPGTAAHARGAPAP